MRRDESQAAVVNGLQTLREALSEAVESLHDRLRSADLDEGEIDSAFDALDDEITAVLQAFEREAGLL